VPPSRKLSLLGPLRVPQLKLEERVNTARRRGRGAMRAGGSIGIRSAAVLSAGLGGSLCPYSVHDKQRCQMLQEKIREDDESAEKD
jgi:hypothetical protein